jgi:Uma2 family endonuclease
LLVVEVAESSLRYDAGRKLRAYARRNVREYWIVDLPHERIEVHRDPHGERYLTHLTFERGASVAPAAFPDLEIAVDEVLPPAAR